jgi:hypothetical protein
MLALNWRQKGTMATLRIERSSEYVNRLRHYTVVIDGKKAGAIANGEVREFNLSPGLHTVRFTIDWAASPVEELTIGEEEVKTLHVSGFKGARWMMPLMIGILLVHLILSTTIGFGSFFLLLLPLGLVLAYYLTFGRRSYLQVKQFTAK